MWGVEVANGGLTRPAGTLSVPERERQKTKANGKGTRQRRMAGSIEDLGMMQRGVRYG
jgi:hypothetical protein